MSGLEKENKNNVLKGQEDDFFVLSLMSQSREDNIWGVNDKTVSHKVWAGFLLSLAKHIDKISSITMYIYSGGKEEEKTFEKVKAYCDKFLINYNDFFSKLKEKINIEKSRIVVDTDERSLIPVLSDIGNLEYRDREKSEEFDLFFNQDRKKSMKNFSHFLYIRSNLVDGKSMTFLRCEENVDDHDAIWACNPSFTSNGDRYSNFQEGFSAYTEKLINAKRS